MGNERDFPEWSFETAINSFADSSVPPSVRRRKIMMVFGTRPEAIKLAPIVLALRDSSLFSVIPVVTGQHREMLDQVLGHFSITPAADLEIMSPNQTLTEITVRTLGRLSPIIESEEPDVIVVQGDTTAAMAGAMAAFYHQVPVVHVEAGLRSGNLASPFPEELNRRLITQLAALHLAPTEAARINLLREGVEPSRILVTGNTVIDALLWSVGMRVPYGQACLEHLDDDDRRVILVTAHRRESWGEPMREVGEALAQIARSEPDVKIVLPVHRNPAVRETLLPPLEGLENVIVCEPLEYGGFVRLIERADLIVTDSGGLQEEGPTLGKPVLVMRDVTERPEAMLAGGVRLVGTDMATIVEGITDLLHDPSCYARMAIKRDVYGDGLAAIRSVDAIAHLLGLGPSPQAFVPMIREVQPQ